MLSPERVCLRLRLGEVKLISMPTENIPKRLDWTKWVDGVVASMNCQNARQTPSPRLWMSPDHFESKDNLAVTATSGQRGLERLDLVSQFSDIVDSTKFLFVGSWPNQMPSWYNSLQSVYHTHYGNKVFDVLGRQAYVWNSTAEKLEAKASFLVNDELGRLSSLTGLTKHWRARQMRSGVHAEYRGTSWFASAVDVHSMNSAQGTLTRLHRLAVLEPESWCGSSMIKSEFLNELPKHGQCPEIWISSPGVGLCLWIGEHFGSLDSIGSRIHIPSAVLGWHPIRDAISFIAQAPSQSILYLVDQFARLQVMVKEAE